MEAEGEPDQEQEGHDGPYPATGCRQMVGGTAHDPATEGAAHQAEEDLAPPRPRGAITRRRLT